MEIGWSELLVIGVVALIVIGPKDLPEMFRTLGRFTAKMRSMARDFSRAMEDAAKESGVKDVADDLRKVANPKSMGLDAVKSAADKFEKWDPLKAGRPGSTAAGFSAAGMTGTAAGAQTQAPQTPISAEVPPTAAPAAVETAPLAPQAPVAPPPVAQPPQDLDEIMASAVNASPKPRRAPEDQSL